MLHFSGNAVTDPHQDASCPTPPRDQGAPENPSLRSTGVARSFQAIGPPALAHRVHPTEPSWSATCPIGPLTPTERHRSLPPGLRIPHLVPCTQGARPGGVQCVPAPRSARYLPRARPLRSRGASPPGVVQARCVSRARLRILQVPRTGYTPSAPLHHRELRSNVRRSIMNSLAAATNTVTLLPARRAHCSGHGIIDPCSASGKRCHATVRCIDRSGSSC